MRYPFQCEVCGEAWVLEASIKVGAPAHAPCPHTTCNGAGVRVWTVPEVVNLDKPFEYTKRGLNIAEGVRTPAQQERAYAKQIGAERTNALRAKRERGLSRVKEGDLRHVSAVPREAYQARQLQFGKHYWQNEGKRALKRDGWLFGG